MDTDQLETPRLRLRRPTSTDLPHMCELESDPEVVRFTPMANPLPPERTEARLREQIAKQTERAPLGVWMAETKAGDFVGWFMLLRTLEPDPELGFMVLRRHWGKGYATEAARRLVELGLNELGYGAILATVNRENAASAKILEKLGFERTGTRMEASSGGAGETTLDLYILWN
jgi:RimJ/RimL family protein N-acetyltransferase